jgi:hypothetical protein
MTIRKCNYIPIALDPPPVATVKKPPPEKGGRACQRPASRRPVVSRPVLVADARRLRIETNFNIDNAVATREFGEFAETSKRGQTVAAW